jgi:hypothetical protein
MSNKRDLRAFVRFDGSGRIVAGSLILRKNKPKVGKWHEIQAYECCNYIPSPSTTTTTTQGGGGTTPTAWVGYSSGSSLSACQQVGGTSVVLYTSVSTLTPGTFLYTDAALTQLYSASLGFVPVAINGVVWQISGVNGSIIDPQPCSSITTTTTTTAAPLECLAYNVSVPDGGSGTLTWTDCNGNNFGPQTFTGPFSSDGYCFVSSSTTGALTVTSLGPCR